MADASICSASFAPHAAPPAAVQRVTDHDVVDLLGYALCEWQRGPCVAGENRAEAVRRIREWQANGDRDAQLWLGGLGLTSLPPVLPPARHLDVSDNALERLPEHLPCAIESLDASGNALTTLPANLPPGLQHLDISNNRLTRLPTGLPIHLSRIIAHDNRLEDLPASLTPSLQKLDVSRNPGSDLQQKADRMIERVRTENARYPRIGGLPRAPWLTQTVNENIYCREQDLQLLRQQSDRLRSEASTPCALASRVLPPAILSGVA